MSFTIIKTYVLIVVFLMLSSSFLHAEMTMHLLDPQGKLLDVFGSHAYDRHFNADYALIAVPFYDGAYVWETNTGICVFKAAYVHFSPNGQIAFVLSLDDKGQKKSTLYAVGTWHKIAELDGFYPSSYNGGTFSPDNTKIMGKTAQDYVAVWDVQTGKQVYELDTTSVCIFSPNSKYLMNVSRWDTDIMIFDVQTGTQILMIEDAIPWGFNKDGNCLLVTRSQYNNNQEWSPEVLLIDLQKVSEGNQNHTTFLQNSYEHILMPHYIVNTGPFAYKINRSQGYMVLTDKHTGQEKIMSKDLVFVPDAEHRTFDCCSVEA